jgi:hypothetical protein
MSARTVHADRLKYRELDPKLCGVTLYVVLGPSLLMECVGWKSQDGEPLVTILLVESHELREVPRRLASLRSGVYHEDKASFECLEVDEVSVDVPMFEVMERSLVVREVV